MSSTSPRIVLVRTAEPMNVGAVARAMKNCALDDLVLVAPRTSDFVTARRVAVHAEELLAAPRIVSSLAEAVADCAWVVGTSSRSLAGRPPPLTPREVGARVAAQARDKTALVFGGEESGLSNDDLARCHALSTVPTGAGQPSLNLAQAVLLYGYECLLARSQPAPRDEAAAAGASPALERELALLEEALRLLLAQSGFADVDRPRHGVVDLLQPLRRAQMTEAEARLWHAALRTALRKLSRG